MRRLVLRILVTLEQLAALVRRWVDRRLGRAPWAVQIIPYRGYGTTRTFYICGRLLAGKALPRSAPTDHWRRNLVAMLRRFQTREVAGVPVQIRYAGVSAQTVSDEEGYFRCALTAASPILPPPAWHRVALEVMGPAVVADPAQTSGRPAQAIVRGMAEVLAPLAGSQFAVISDIDDTVLPSNATRFWQMLRLVLLENAHTRLPFPGVAAFYGALQRGRKEGVQNPIFYLSSSPWNLYDFLLEFMQINGLPAGPILLADYGFDAGKFIHPSHAEHKEAHIRTLLDTYPTLPFLLIGDSGQHDPEIYRTIVEAYPKRIGAVYIRNVSSARRGAQIAQLAAATQAHDVEMLLVADTLAAAQHALTQGWITATSLAAIRAEVQTVVGGGIV